jgi:mitochondrial import receptor subunit TOM40
MEKSEASFAEPTSYWDFLTSNPIFSTAGSYLTAFHRKREDLGLSYPGQIDNIAKEVERDVFLNALAVPGLRAEISKTLAYGKPLFQISHQFAMGSQSQPPYTLIAMYGSPKVNLPQLKVARTKSDCNRSLCNT